jgi:two-component system LytT family sensor kinase
LLCLDLQYNFVHYYRIPILTTKTIYKEGFIDKFRAQCSLLFSNHRIWAHLVILAIVSYFLFFETTVKGGVKGGLIYISISVCFIYTFLLLIIPLARAKMNRWIVWLGFIINIIFWLLITEYIHPTKTYSPEERAYQYEFGVFFATIWFYLCVYYFFDLFVQQKFFNNYKKQLEQKIEAENKFLKTQINPHFLFNTLNNIYAQSIQNPQTSATTIKQLKNMLQYMMYDCEEDFVPLQDEIEFIKSYTNLEHLRNEQQRMKSKIELKGNITDQKIAPLLLINFIENAFKHGVKADIEEAFVYIEIQVSDKKFSMTVTNSVPTQAKPKNALPSDGGIGLRNIKKRLALIYPKRHDLSFDNNAERYVAKLNINLY